MTIKIREFSSAGRASALQAEGHRFEPCNSHHNAGVAQLVEQLICNQQVVGSSPITSSKKTGTGKCLSLLYGRVPEWPKGTDCKSAAYSFGGSNPPSPTKQSVLRGYSLTRTLFCFNDGMHLCVPKYGSALFTTISSAERKIIEKYGNILTPIH